MIVKGYGGLGIINKGIGSLVAGVPVPVVSALVDVGGGGSGSGVGIPLSWTSILEGLDPDDLELLDATSIKPEVIPQNEELEREAKVYLHTIKNLQKKLSGKDVEIHDLQEKLEQEIGNKAEIHVFDQVEQIQKLPIPQQYHNLIRIINFIKKHWLVIVIVGLSGVVLYYVLKRERGVDGFYGYSQTS